MGSSKAKSEHCLRTYEEIGILFAQIIKEMYPTLRREGAGSRIVSKHPSRDRPKKLSTSHHVYLFSPPFFLIFCGPHCEKSTIL